jgi:hypothetical protein
MIMSPVDYPVEHMSDVNVTFNEDVNNTDHGYTLFKIINYRSSGQDTGHYTAICKSNETDDWFDYNDENIQKSQFRKKWRAQKVASVVGFYSLLQKIRTLGIERGYQHTKSDQHDLYVKLYDIHQYNVD